MNFFHIFYGALRYSEPMAHLWQCLLNFSAPLLCVNRLQYCAENGAQDWTRTSTACAPPPQDGVSTNFTTWAQMLTREKVGEAVWAVKIEVFEGTKKATYPS